MAMSNRDRALGELVRVGDQQVDPDRGAVERLRTEIGLPRCLIGHSETRAVDGHLRRSSVLVGVAVDLFVAGPAVGRSRRAPARSCKNQPRVK
jgi:hypothetical protein